MDICDIANNAKKAIDIANEVKNVELKEVILNLKEQMIELREENISLKEQLSKRDYYNMQFNDNCYWSINEDGTKEGPYCSVCWDKDKEAVRLTQSNIDKHHFKCGSCGNNFYVKDYKQRG